MWATRECNNKPICVIAVLGFKSAKGQAGPKKRLDLEMKVVDKLIGQNVYFFRFKEQPIPAVHCA